MHVTIHDKLPLPLIHVGDEDRDSKDYNNDRRDVIFFLKCAI